VNKKRKMFLENKSKEIQNKIEILQAKNCQDGKQLICNVKQYCGYTF
jgi:hypothetical protein